MRLFCVWERSSDYTSVDNCWSVGHPFFHVDFFIHFFKCHLVLPFLFFLLHSQQWNTGFYPLNKSYIFHRLLFSQCENIKLLWRHIIYCIQCVDLKETCSKPKENVINSKFNDFGVKYRIYFTRRTGFFNISSSAKPSWRYKKSCLTHWNKFRIQRQTIQYPLYIFFLPILTSSFFYSLLLLLHILEINTQIIILQFTNPVMLVRFLWVFFKNTKSSQRNQNIILSSYKTQNVTLTLLKYPLFNVTKQTSHKPFPL